MKTFRFLVPWIIACQLLAACQPGLSANQDSSVGKIDLQPCTVQGVEAQCGTLSVFEDRAARQGRKIDLRVVVVKAKDQRALPDPLFHFDGGPGGAGSDSVNLVKSIYAEINQKRDVVFFDQRGVGGSNKLVCPEMNPGEANQDYIERCLAGLPGDLRFYTTTIAMDDVDDIRQALGYDKINLYGGSYGGTAAQVYLNRHAEHVRSFTFVRSTLLQIPFSDAMVRATQLSLERLFERCAADAACQAAYPDLRSEFDGLKGKLAQPVTTGVFDPKTSQPVSITLATFEGTVHYMLKETHRTVKLPGLIHRAAQGDWDGLAQETLHMQNQLSPEFDRLVMPKVIWCFEDWASGTETEIRRLGQGSYYLENSLESQAAMKNCPMLPDPGESAHHGPALKSDVPVLIFSAEGDPQNPPENVAGYQEIWPNSLQVIQPATSHEDPNDPCWTEIASAFVEQGSVKDLPLACAKEVKAPEFK